MPLPMTHLSVANRLIEIGLQIKDESQFYLGAISPDAIHMRPNADRAAKNVTHLIPEGKRVIEWYDTDEAECIKRIIEFVASNKSTTNPDFLMGYAVHILTDMYWTTWVYQKFVVEYQKSDAVYQKSAAPPQDQQKAYYEDTDIVDYIQYTIAPWREDVWQLLQNTEYSNFLNLLSADEIKKWNERTLNWYTAPENQYKFEGTPKYITQQGIEDFIPKCAEAIASKINRLV